MAVKVKLKVKLDGKDAEKFVKDGVIPSKKFNYAPKNKQK